MAKQKIKVPWRKKTTKNNFPKGFKTPVPFITKEEAMKDPVKWKEYCELHEKKIQGAKKAMAERKKMRETLEEMISSDYENLQDWLNFDFTQKVKKSSKDGLCSPDTAYEWFEDHGRKITVQDAICLAALHNAIVKGDQKGIEFIRDTLGEKPRVEVEANANIQTVQEFTDLAKALYSETQNAIKEETENTEEETKEEDN